MGAHAPEQPTARQAQTQVIDYRLGMDERTAKNAIEPFFITKSSGVGTGNP